MNARRMRAGPLFLCRRESLDVPITTYAVDNVSALPADGLVCPIQLNLDPLFGTKACLDTLHILFNFCSIDFLRASGGVTVVEVVHPFWR